MKLAKTESCHSAEYQRKGVPQCVAP